MYAKPARKIASASRQFPSPVPLCQGREDPHHDPDREAAEEGPHWVDLTAVAMSPMRDWMRHPSRVMPAHQSSRTPSRSSSVNVPSIADTPTGAAAHRRSPPRRSIDRGPAGRGLGPRFSRCHPAPGGRGPRLPGSGGARRECGSTASFPAFAQRVTVLGSTLEQGRDLGRGEQRLDLWQLRFRHDTTIPEQRSSAGRLGRSGEPRRAR